LPRGSTIAHCDALFSHKTRVKVAIICGQKRSIYSPGCDQPTGKSLCFNCTNVTSRKSNIDFIPWTAWQFQTVISFPSVKLWLILG
jgi:hypothetical protein